MPDNEVPKAIRFNGETLILYGDEPLKSCGGTWDTYWSGNEGDYRLFERCRETGKVMQTQE